MEVLVGEHLRELRMLPARGGAVAFSEDSVDRFVPLGANRIDVKLDARIQPLRESRQHGTVGRRIEDDTRNHQGWLTINDLIEDCVWIRGVDDLLGTSGIDSGHLGLDAFEVLLVALCNDDLHAMSFRGRVFVH